MPIHTHRLIDPTASELLATLEEALAQARDRAAEWGRVGFLGQPIQPGPGEWQKLLADVARRPEGCRYWWCLWPEMPQPLTILGVAWWTDHVRRTHLYVEAAGSHGSSSFAEYSDAREGTSSHRERLLFEHPLELLHPDLVWLVSERTRKRRVLCGCGLFGTLDELAWMGDCCGPCHDRRQEGEPPLPLQAARRLAAHVTHLAPTPDGSVVVARLAAAPPEQPDDEPTPFLLACWRSPLTPGAPPAWESQGPLDVQGLCCSLEWIIVFGRFTMEVRSLANGRVLQSLPLPEDWGGERHTLLIGPDHNLLAEVQLNEIGVYGGSWNYTLHVWPMSTPLRFDRMNWSISSTEESIATTADGRLLLVGREDRIDVRDATTGNAVRSLFVPGAISIREVLVAPDNTVLARVILREQGRAALVRWDRVLNSDPPPRGALRRMLGRLGLPAEHPTHTQIITELGRNPWEGRIALSPTGQLLRGTSSGFQFWDAVALQERGSVRLRGGIRDFAFTAKGEVLIVDDDATLRLWTWREWSEE